MVAYIGLTDHRAASIEWMGALVLGFSHTTAFAFGNFLYQDYYRRGFDKKPEYAFVKYYSTYGSTFVIGRMASQVLCSMRSKSSKHEAGFPYGEVGVHISTNFNLIACSRDGEALLMLAIYFLAFLHVTVENETFHVRPLVYHTKSFTTVHTNSHLSTPLNYRT